MTAQASNRTPEEVRWKYKQFTLKSGQHAYQGSSLCLELATAKLVVAATGDGLVFMGFAVDEVDASLADKTINVDLIEEIVGYWYANGTSSDAVAATDVMKDCYFIDDQTVSIRAAGNPLAGRILAFDTTKGVLVQKRSKSVDLAPMPSLPAFAAADCAPTTIVNGATYDVPTTAANSTLTLPAATPDGTIAYFTADGSKNGHTVQYRDETGTTVVTTALTASKRHLVIATKRGGKWFANAYVSP